MYTPLQQQQSIAMLLHQNACEAFDKYVDGRMTAHNNYIFQMVKRCDYDVQSVGFIGDDNMFYAVSNDKFHVIKINDTYSDTIDFSETQFSSTIQSISQNKFTNNVFLVSSGNDISILNSENLNIAKIPLEPRKRSVSWMHDPTHTDDNKYTKFCTYDEKGEFKVFDVARLQYESSCQLAPGFAKIYPHPSEPYVIIAGEMLQLIDTRTNGRVAMLEMQPGFRCLSWMPEDRSGIIIGYDNGSIDLFSLADQKAIVTQQISLAPIASVEFCPNQSGTALIASDSEIVFANLKSWGYGRMTVTRTHQGHVGRIVDAHWFDSSAQNPLKSLKVISCDDQRMINVFEMPIDYIPVFQA